MDISDTQAALDFANAATVDLLTELVDVDGVTVVAHHDSRKITTLDLEDKLPAPRRHRGTTSLHTARGLIGWVTDHRIGPDVDLIADVDHLTITAVLNPARSTPSWGDYRGRLTLRRSPEWARWVAIDGKAIPQGDFAGHVQACARDIVHPAALDMLEVAETLTLNVDATISSAVRQRDGQRRLVFNETSTARAGVEREVDVPEFITLRLPIFDGTDPVDVTVRLLYRQRDGGVFFAVQIIDLVPTERGAFVELADEVGAALGVTVVEGQI